MTALELEATAENVDIRLTSTGVGWLTRLTALQRLGLSLGWWLEADGAELLSTMTSLRELRFRNIEMPDPGSLQLLARLPLDRVHLPQSCYNGELPPSLDIADDRGWQWRFCDEGADEPWRR